MTFDAIEFFENAFLVGASDADTGICNGYRDAFGGVGGSYGDSATFGVFDGVCEKITDDFFEVGAVGVGYGVCKSLVESEFEGFFGG